MVMLMLMMMRMMMTMMMIIGDDDDDDSHLTRPHITTRTQKALTSCDKIGNEMIRLILNFHKTTSRHSSKDQLICQQNRAQHEVRAVSKSTRNSL